MGIPVWGFGSEGRGRPAAGGAEDKSQPEDAGQVREEEWLASASLEELMRVRVTSVARKEQSLMDVPAAIHVVTQDDIRRSGASTIPDALRMVPGLHVAQVATSSWAVSARGFTGRFANKMLVLIDGRSVYTNLYSGVYWEQNEVLMEDIERIEVIRGPGATMWGANAVNGVINIITRSAAKTQGTLVTMDSGITEPYQMGLRYGGSVGKAFAYRITGRAFQRGPQMSSRPQDTGEANDAWRGRQFGLRADWQASERDELMFQAGVYSGTADQTIDADFPRPRSGFTIADRVQMDGGMGLFRWKRALSGRSEVLLQTSFSEERRSERFGQGEFQMLDVDLQHRYRVSPRHDLIWGGGWRLYRDTIVGFEAGTGRRLTIFEPESASDSLYTAFVQDEIALVREKLTLTVGAKLQHNPYTQYDLQPNLRLLWSPTAKMGYWFAASRAVRVPSRRDLAVHLDFPAPPPAPPGSVLCLRGDPNAPSEAMVALEAGLRRQFTRSVFLDVAVFQSGYDRLQNTQAGIPAFEATPSPRVVIPIRYQYTDSPVLRGMELSGSWAPHYSWKFSANYSYLWADRSLTSGQSAWPTGFTAPSHQLQMRSSWDLSPRVTLDSSLYRVTGLSRYQVPGYWRADLRLGFRASENLELSLAGQNLTDPRHLEFVSEDFVRASLLRRNVRLNVAWRW
jgi:iron complex outermembrane receptor protein